MKASSLTTALAAMALLILPACPGDDGGTSTTMDETSSSGDGDGDMTGDGDGDPATGDGDGDATGDGDGDATGDGDGDATGDGDGDTGGGGAACMGAAAPDGTLAIGEQFSHWAGFLPDGSDWNYCEMEGTPFLLIISGAWCGPCQDLASGMAGMGTSFTDLDAVNAGLAAGTLGFVEILLDNFNDFGAVSVDDLHAWEMMFPNENVKLVGDPTEGQNGNEPLWIYMGPVHNGGVPAGVLVDADFNLETLGGIQEAITTAANNYGG